MACRAVPDGVDFARRRSFAVRAGMTLLEVILAIAILGGSLAMLGEFVRIGTRSAHAARVLSTAQLLADIARRRDHRRYHHPPIDPGRRADDFGGFDWQYVVQMEQVDQQGLLAVAVTGARKHGCVAAAGVVHAGALDDRPGNRTQSGDGRRAGRGQYFQQLRLELVLERHFGSGDRLWHGHRRNAMRTCPQMPTCRVHLACRWLCQYRSGRTRHTGTASDTRRRGLTLLELMLALTLSTFVLVAISMAIDLHLRVLQSRRGHVERIQLARSVLTIIANDLRSTVQQNTTDFSALASLASAALSGAAADATGATGTDSGSGGTGTGTAQAPGRRGTGGGTGDRDERQAPGQVQVQGPAEAPGQVQGQGRGREQRLERAPQPAARQAPQLRIREAMTRNRVRRPTSPSPARCRRCPGCMETSTNCRLDVSRLPRVDEFQRMATDTRRDIPAGYPERCEDGGLLLCQCQRCDSSGVVNRRTGRCESGLVRRVMDRAVTLYASENGNLAGTAASGGSHCAGSDEHRVSVLRWHAMVV